MGWWLPLLTINDFGCGLYVNLVVQTFPLHLLQEVLLIVLNPKHWMHAPYFATKACYVLLFQDVGYRYFIFK